jgi:hypothetical protein
MDTTGRTVLDPAATKASAKQMFGKDELAAILRFGAEELFKSNETEAEETVSDIRPSVPCSPWPLQLSVVVPHIPLGGQ